MDSFFIYLAVKRGFFMLKKFVLSNGKLLESDSDESNVLIYVHPDETEKRLLIEKYKVDEHTLNSALDPNELSRLEFEPDHVAVIYMRPKSYTVQDNFLFRLLSTGLFLFKNRLILVMEDDTPILTGKYFARISSFQDLVLKLFYQSINHFMGHLKVFNMMSEELEHKINASIENRYLLNMFTLEKSLVYYLNAIDSNGALIEKLKTNSLKIDFAAEHLELLDDLIIESKQCSRQAEIYSQVLSSLMDARASIVSNNLNQLIKRLTIITIGIMLPTLIVSIFSMNVRLPVPQESALWPFLSILAVGVLSTIAIFLISIFKKW